MVTEAYAIHEQWMKSSFNSYGELLRDRMAMGALISAADHMQAVRRRRELCAEMAAAFGDLDLLITAAQPAEAPRINAVPKWSNLERPTFTMPFNVTGYPALSVCTGFGNGGLPVAMQIVGRPFDEATVFRAGHAYETASSWRSRRPALASGSE
jgi:aspartyl-tRNA(Asn)/glutamyl-tRNA(Gln) amidotransferase subunit A